MILHILQNNFEAGLDVILSSNTTSQTSVLFTQDSIYKLIQLPAMTSNQCTLYALEQDVEIRGLKNLISPDIILIDDKYWVSLVVNATQVISW